MATNIGPLSGGDTSFKAMPDDDKGGDDSTKDDRFCPPLLKDRADLGSAAGPRRKSVSADAAALIAQELGYEVSGDELLRFSGKSSSGVSITKIQHPGEYH